MKTAKPGILILTLFVVTASMILLTNDVLATNGYFQHGYGIQSQGMAGVAVALPRNTMVAASNPAGMVFIGNRYDVELALFNPNRQYTITGNPSGADGTFPLTPGTIESDSKIFLLPSLGANWMIDPKSSIGFSIYGNGGMNTNYDTKTFDNPMAPVQQPTGVDLMQVFMATTYARKLTPKHAVGITGIVAYQRFKAGGLQAFGGYSSDMTKLSDNDYSGSTGFGARVGYLGEIFPRLHLGASYQTKMFMTEFDEYAGLFAEQGDFDIPANWAAGMALQATSNLILAVDVQQILYSGIKSVGSPMIPADFQQGILLGDDNGAGFGWEDMTIVKIGLEWEGIPDLPFRLGYSYGEQPIPESETMFNILAPGVIEQHITFGFSRKMCGGRELSFAVMHAINNCVDGPNPMEAPGAQMIDLEMNQWEFSIGFGF